MDFGANYGYFSWRIKEDFPNAKITMVDSRPFLKFLFDLNEVEGATLYSEDMSLDRIKEFLKDKHFDLILLMNIIHHFENPEEVFDTFSESADTIILETAYKDQPLFTGLENRIQSHISLKHPIQINRWLEHERPIYYFNKEKPIIARIESGGGTAKRNIERLNETFGWFGKEAYPGTLNLRLPTPIEYQPAFRIESYYFTRMYLNGLPVFAIRDENMNPPRTFLEIISEHNLRKKFSLKDGDEVFLSFEVK